MLNLTLCLSCCCLFLSVLGAEDKAAPQTVWCLGDSLTAGYGVAPKQAYPALLEQRLRNGNHKVRIINAGLSGSTTASGLERYSWLKRSHGLPDVLLLALGANDGLRGQSLIQAKSNLSKIIEKAQHDGVQVLLAGMRIPNNYGENYTSGFKNMFADLATEHELSIIPFLLEGIALDPQFNLPDGIHPNVAGHVKIAETVLQHLEPLLRDE